MPLKDLFTDASGSRNRKDNLQSDQNNNFICSACGANVKLEDKECPACGINLDEELKPAGTNASPHFPMLGMQRSALSQPSEMNIPIRYSALNTITNIYTILAVAVAVITVLIVVIELGTGIGVLGIEGGIGSLIFVLITLAIGGSIALSLFAAAETIKVFIDIEENTRKAAENIKRQ